MQASASRDENRAAIAKGIVACNITGDRKKSGHCM
jgi:hypothetical protein